MSGYEKEHISILLNTRDRTKGTIEDATWFLDSQITFSKNPQKSYRMRLENTLMPKAQYDIDSNFNVFRVIEDDGAADDLITITIDPGNYTVQELIAEVESELDTNTANGNDYTLSYDDITNKITIFYTTGTSAEITIDTIANGSTLNQILGFGKPNTEYITGQDNQVVVLSGAGNAVVATNEVDLATKAYIVVETDISSNNFYDHQTQKNIGAIVPMNVDRNVIKLFENHLGHKSKMANLHSLRKIQLTLKDQYGNAISNNGIDYSTNLTIFELTETWKK